MRKVISKIINYIPVEWGIKDDGKITAFVRFTRVDNDYSMYGDDADVYEEFEREGFTITKTTNNYAEAYKWLRDNADSSIGG
jgi:hypothetical protein